MSTKNLSQELKDLQDAGCSPSLYLRGDVWRAHINRAGNFWAEDKIALNAVRKAVNMWRNAGKPMDGVSDER